MDFKIGKYTIAISLCISSKQTNLKFLNKLALNNQNKMHKLQFIKLARTLHFKKFNFVPSLKDVKELSDNYKWLKYYEN